MTTPPDENCDPTYTEEHLTPRAAARAARDEALGAQTYTEDFPAPPGELCGESPPGYTGYSGDVC